MWPKTTRLADDNRRTNRYIVCLETYFHNSECNSSYYRSRIELILPKTFPILGVILDTFVLGLEESGLPQCVGLYIHDGNIFKATINWSCKLVVVVVIVGEGLGPR